MPYFNVSRQKIHILNVSRQKENEERKRGKRKRMRKEKEEEKGEGERVRRKRKEKEERVRGKSERKEKEERGKRKRKEKEEYIYYPAFSGDRPEQSNMEIQGMNNPCNIFWFHLPFQAKKKEFQIYSCV